MSGCSFVVVFLWAAGAAMAAPAVSVFPIPGSQVRLKARSSRSAACRSTSSGRYVVTGSRSGATTGGLPPIPTVTAGVLAVQALCPWRAGHRAHPPRHRRRSPPARTVQGGQAADLPSQTGHVRVESQTTCFAFTPAPTSSPPPSRRRPARWRRRRDIFLHPGWARPGRPRDSRPARTRRLVQARTRRRLRAADFRVQRYDGQPVLTWWQGYIKPAGFGQGSDVIYDSGYRQVATVHAGNGMIADLHEFLLTPQEDGLDHRVRTGRVEPVSVRRHALRGDRGRRDPGDRCQDGPGDVRMARARPCGDQRFLLQAATDRDLYDFFHVNSIDSSRTATC